MKTRLQDLEVRLAEALRERDIALAQLASERARHNALRLYLEWGQEQPLPDYPPGTGPGEPPLRYQWADRVNSIVKASFGPLHARLRGARKKA
ncbi:MAG: hypothetical protein ACOZQL_31970 [Myxococcota bacterium]